MKVIANDIWVCEDCYAFVANGEPDEPPEDWTPEGIESLGEHVVCADGHQEFSRLPCDACGCYAGARHEVAIMGEDEDDGEVT